MFKRKEKETNELLQRTIELYGKCKQIEKPVDSSEQNYAFVLIPEGDALTLRLQKAVEKTQKTINVMLSQKRLLPWLLNDETVENALKRGIIVRVLTDQSNRLTMPKDVIALEKKHSFEIRYTKMPLSICFRIYDGKEAFLTTATFTDCKETPIVWSNNSSFVELAQNYFDAAWFSAVEPKEQEFKPDARQFDYLFANMNDGFSYNRILFDPDGHPKDFVILFANEPFLSMLGLNKQALGKRATEVFLDIEKQPSLMTALYKVAIGMEARLEYYSNIRNRWFSFLVYSPEKSYFVLMTEDVTERKKAEEKYRQLFNTIPSGVAVYQAVDDGVDFVFVDINQTAEKIEGLSKEEILGKRLTNVFQRVDDLGLLSALQRVYQTGKSEFLPTSLYQGKRNVNWRENWVYKLPNGNVVAVYNDVTERLKSEKSLRDSEANYRELINCMNDTVWVIDYNSKFIDVNNAATKTYGYSREELLSMDVFDLDKNLGHQEILKIFKDTIAESSKVYATVYTTKDGRGIPVEISQSLVMYQGKQAILSVVRDVTERKKLAASIQEKIQLNQVLLDAFPCVALLLKPSTREIVASNMKAVEVGAVPGQTCFTTWGRRESPCPWCLAPNLWATQKAQHLEIEWLGVVWDAYWVPVSEDLYMHYAFDITVQRKAKIKR
ncbi:MAG: PAS domain S-box protein [Candidatus Bathyarchaeota archaeon]|nr:PAS domain S-box protein [Candidatus Bathyarchaeota archaeon]